jgi:hypothetical protein
VTHASPAQLRLQHEVLGSEVLDHCLLLAREPADERGEHQMQPKHTRESIRSMRDDDFGQFGYRPNMPHSNEKCDLGVARKIPERLQTVDVKG